MRLFKAFVKVVLSCFALVGGLLFLGLLLFSISMVIKRAPTQPTQKTDALVVLTGGSNRVEEGLRVYQKDLGTYLLISGVHKDVKVGELLALLWKGPMIDPAGIVLDPRATTTAENASYSIEWIKEHDIKSIRLITAYYHMPRAYWEFKRRMPELKILPHGVQPEAGPSYVKMLFAEYGKTILTLLPTSPEA